jgi:hypothetical protein
MQAALTVHPPIGNGDVVGWPQRLPNVASEVVTPGPGELFELGVWASHYNRKVGGGGWGWGGRVGCVCVWTRASTEQEDGEQCRECVQ